MMYLPSSTALLIELRLAPIAAVDANAYRQQFASPACEHILNAYYNIPYIYYEIACTPLPEGPNSLLHLEGQLWSEEGVLHLQPPAQTKQES